MKILCTFPGKHGDSLWALPTVRALSEAYDTPVDLLMSPSYASILSLYARQPYIGTVQAWSTWAVQNTAPMTPWSPFEETLHHQAEGIDPGDYDHVLHLGYREWPTAPLPQYVEAIVRREYPQITFAPIDLTRPWITPPYTLPAQECCVGFTDEHFELKYGLYLLLFNQFQPTGHPVVNISTSPRWKTEGHQPGYDWVGAAAWIGASRLFVGCCSALHVLAVAMGTPVIVVEPNPHRHNPIFYPLGKVGKVQLLLGNDGQPTIDARHLADAINAVLTKEAACAS